MTSSKPPWDDDLPPVTAYDGPKNHNLPVLVTVYTQSTVTLFVKLIKQF